MFLVGFSNPFLKDNSFSLYSKEPDATFREHRESQIEIVQGEVSGSHKDFKPGIRIKFSMSVRYQ